jgi:hypothetical protein
MKNPPIKQGALDNFFCVKLLNISRGCIEIGKKMAVA